MQTLMESRQTLERFYHKAVAIKTGIVTRTFSLPTINFKVKYKVKHINWSSLQLVYKQTCVLLVWCNSYRHKMYI